MIKGLTAAALVAGLLVLTGCVTGSTAPVGGGARNDASATVTTSTVATASVPATGLSAASSTAFPAPKVPIGAAVPTRTPTGAELGRSVFVDGMASDGELKFTGDTQSVGNGACQNCHGANGAGAIGPAISWRVLTTRTNTAHGPRFVYANPDQVIAVITTGIRPDGTRLSFDMPRYALPGGDALGLIEFLRTLR